MKFDKIYNVELSHKEVEGIMRNFFNIPDDVTVNITIKEAKVDDVWIEVPPNWEKSKCPDHDDLLGRWIEVQHRDGTTSTGLHTDWTSSWVQNGGDYGNNREIVKYRVLG